MSYENVVIFTSGILFGVAACLIVTAKYVKKLKEENRNLFAALLEAGDTILDQSEEIQNILKHANKCDSELIN